MLHQRVTHATSYPARRCHQRSGAKEVGTLVMALPLQGFLENPSSPYTLICSTGFVKLKKKKKALHAHYGRIKGLGARLRPKSVSFTITPYRILVRGRQVAVGKFSPITSSKGPPNLCTMVYFQSIECSSECFGLMLQAGRAQGLKGHRFQSNTSSVDLFLISEKNDNSHGY